MPHDKNGTELKSGDIVTMEFKVQQVYPNVEYCNLSLESIDSMYPSGPTVTLNSVNTKMVTKKPTQTLDNPTN